MPRVITRKKSARGSEYRCTKCGSTIEPGSDYFQWVFRYGGARRQHATCGYPTRSQLTQSLMSDVYAGIEEVEAAGDDMGSFADALEALVETARGVAEQYEAAAEAFGNAGENQERAEALTGWIDDLDGKAEEIRDAVETFESAKSSVQECPV